MSSDEERIVCIQARRRRTLDALGLLGTQLGLESLGHAYGDLGLDFEHVLQLTVERFRPNLAIRARVDELHHDSESIGSPPGQVPSCV